MKHSIVFILLIGLLIGLSFGVILGMTLQQRLFINGAVEFGESLEGTNIDAEINIDFNETLLIEGFKEAINMTLNNSGEKND